MPSQTHLKRLDPHQGYEFKCLPVRVHRWVDIFNSGIFILSGTVFAGRVTNLPKCPCRHKVELCSKVATKPGFECADCRVPVIKRNIHLLRCGFVYKLVIACSSLTSAHLTGAMIGCFVECLNSSKFFRRLVHFLLEMLNPFLCRHNYMGESVFKASIHRHC